VGTNDAARSIPTVELKFHRYAAGSPRAATAHLRYGLWSRLRGAKRGITALPNDLIEMDERAFILALDNSKQTLGDRKTINAMVAVHTPTGGTSSRAGEPRTVQLVRNEQDRNFYLSKPMFAVASEIDLLGVPDDLKQRMFLMTGEQFLRATLPESRPFYAYADAGIFETGFVKRYPVHFFVVVNSPMRAAQATQRVEQLKEMYEAAKPIYARVGIRLVAAPYQHPGTANFLEELKFADDRPLYIAEAPRGEDVDSDVHDTKKEKVAERFRKVDATARCFVVGAFPPDPGAASADTRGFSYFPGRSGQDVMHGACFLNSSNLTRFTAAHELGHLLDYGLSPSGDHYGGEFCLLAKSTILEPAGAPDWRSTRWIFQDEANHWHATPSGFLKP
jgi:hypothetical protein